uniref:non-specific serine/threonine protein kinase n=1 Tax=Oryza glumipatula TaxID=40148 RepID=A0A0E0A1U5_9ORYZ
MERSTPGAMAARSWLILLCLALAATAGILQARAQLDSKGFISVDCGLPGKTSYVDDKTKISYAADDGFTDGGSFHNISAEYFAPALSARYYNVRSFPDGAHNCYTLRSLVAGHKYLIRATFMYGNYDGLSKLPIFDVYIGVNFWMMVNITDPAGSTLLEAIVVVPDDFVQVCLVNTGTGTPFISGLDLRPLEKKLYPQATETQGLSLFGRWNFGPTSNTEIIRYGNNPNLCTNGNSCQPPKNKSKLAIYIVVPIVLVLAIVSVTTLLYCLLRRKKQVPFFTYKGSMNNSVKPQNEIMRYGPTNNGSGHNSSMRLENRRFTYNELEKITNKFQRVLGQGGFGKVYDGFLEDGTEVAVKVRTESSNQGDKEFLAEAQILTRIHHKNLVSMIGYCKDEKYMALVYEYMSEGTLQEHIAGKGNDGRYLTWKERLRIALESAQVFLLHGELMVRARVPTQRCNPPLIHRDVKGTNILLNTRLEAKIADFGLSKVFNPENGTHVSTNKLVGTPRYVDPEYQSTMQPTTKSDVYSFGVVLLELVTGEPAILRDPEPISIIHWAQQRLARGNIEGVVDASMHGDYDVNGLWKVADIALKCTALSSAHRPTMTDVVAQLQECLELEDKHQRFMSRYPDDPRDRVWTPWDSPSNWTEISTTRPVQQTYDDLFEVPTAVMQTAIVPMFSTDNIELAWVAYTQPKDPSPGYIAIMHFSELELSPPSRDVREFYINLNGNMMYSKGYKPVYLYAHAIYNTNPFLRYPQYNISINATYNSTMRPFINAIEVYSVFSTTTIGTYGQDASAMMVIKEKYQVKKNWMGDPCIPTEFTWESLTCSYENSKHVIKINLSSSGLSGEISSSFGDLKALQYLDLSNNNLTGSIPDALSQLPSLTVLYGNNPNLCTNDNSCQAAKHKSKLAIYIVVPVVLVLVIVSVTILLFCLLGQKKKQGSMNTSIKPQNEANYVPTNDSDGHGSSMKLENRRFTYKDLEKITNNFQRVLSRGGFGKVYDGFLEDDTQVAVKLRSESSNQGDKEFLAEAQILTRIHHKNFVSMIGYCKDGKYMALVYEYINNGRYLTWRERLRIALESAQGLEYLHKWCNPPLIHRDVKATNILLNTRLEAKIADFGLSKSFNLENGTHVSTNTLVGTPGYVDPEYQATMQPSTKSDVYSFGVVLLELVTGKSAVLRDPEPISIIHWTQQRLAQGNIEEVVDACMCGDHDVNGVWKVADIAFKCTAQVSARRPTMTDVVAQLQECLELEEEHCAVNDANNNFYTSNNSNPNSSYETYAADHSIDVSQNSVAFEMEKNFGRMPSTAPGFISVDCGLPGKTSYVDDKTKISYAADDGFTDGGSFHNISAEYITPALSARYHNVRSFPDGARNCYTLRSLVAGLKYLIRATFLYGNYDGLSKLPIFDVYIGVNFWMMVNISDPSGATLLEAIVVVPDDFVQVCLVNTGTGTPFISGLDLRPLEKKLYPQANDKRGLSLFGRWNFGPISTTEFIRYPDDPHDRIWMPWVSPSYWTEVSTTRPVQHTDEDVFDAPTKVMQTAIAPLNASSNIEFAWVPYTQPKDPAPGYIAVMHFSELQLRSSNASRQFYINLNGNMVFSQGYTPAYLYADAIFNSNPFLRYPQYNISINATANSTLPPIINAIEVFSVFSTATVGTDGQDASTMMVIKEKYQVKKNWMGDPCVPKTLAWDKLTCSYDSSKPARITDINLSSGGLSGEISSAFANLKALQNLDLSNNNLTGSIPDALSQLPSLAVLDLTGNQLNGSIPSGLLKRVQDGTLNIKYGNNPNLCTNDNSCQPAKHKSKLAIYVAVPVVLVLVIVSVTILLFCLLGRKKKQGSMNTSVKPQNETASYVPTNGSHGHGSSMQLENRRFTYNDLEKITNNFQRVLGEGGFGKVYDGFLEDGTQVAVKLRSESSNQGDKEFLAEAQILTRIHHKSLVSMIGYCKDGEYMALVYEYMSEGTLQEHISGKRNNGRYLTWRERLRIALESAQGLEYLHKWCNPPLIHRDVKATNILLNARLEAKIADFGLSKAFNLENGTHISTNTLVGTPGYVDPEYHATMQPTTKSDVYSFGVVLLELVTGKPSILRDPEPISIIHWAQQRLARGNIEGVVDARMRGDHDVNGVWKVADIALKCTTQVSAQRPTMTDVVAQLQECLELEEERCAISNTNYNFYTDNNSNSNSSYDMYATDHSIDEAIVVVPDDFVQVCLVNTGTGTPFISGLDLRPLKSTLYPQVTETQGLSLFGRWNFGPTSNTEIIRYPDDPHDREWVPWINPFDWTVISTTTMVQNIENDIFEAPSRVMQTAITPRNASGNIEFAWDAYTQPKDPTPGYIANFYFTEVQLLPSNALRQFYINLNGRLVYNESYTPLYLYADLIYEKKPFLRYPEYNISINATSNSTLPPIINAIEVFSVMPTINVATDSEDGFISIDCGLPEKTSYVDDANKLKFTSDEAFTDAGTIHNVSSEFATPTTTTDRSMYNVRSFPAGARNCYTLPSVVPGSKYLVRAKFLYGNYDGLNKPPVFDLHLGVNFWQTVTVPSADWLGIAEVIAVVPDDFLQVCLVNTGAGTPFISGLDLRPLPSSLYAPANATQGLVLLDRRNFGASGSTVIRYPDDTYDRVWWPWSNPPAEWSDISTADKVQNTIAPVFDVPSVVMQTAITTRNSSIPIQFSWDTKPNHVYPDPGSIFTLYVTELELLAGNAVRQFNVTINGVIWTKAPYKPVYLSTDAMYNGDRPYRGITRYNFSLNAAGSSTLPPILNAAEAFSVISTADLATDAQDVSAITAIKAKYQVKKNWTGDPCAPKTLAWDGLTCSYAISTPPRITGVNMSYAGLSGDISSYFANLKEIKNLDLSHNNLTGSIPNVISQLQFLAVLYGNNPNLCSNSSSCQLSQKKSNSMLAVYVAVPVVVIGAVAVFLIFFIRKKTNKSKGAVKPQILGNGVQSHSQNGSGGSLLELHNRQFTYKDLAVITNNFQRVLGKGGFGPVYDGFLKDGTHVAVKLRDESSSQGYSEFLTEAQTLTKIHHKNLVALIGYCKDEIHLALVYEHMSEGTLEDKLRGKDRKGRSLTWRERLRIVLESAQGLEYLHKACSPRFVHRDVKSSNILLNANLEAKVADFGLTTAFKCDGDTHVSTVRVVGTYGYLAPEYATALQVSEKIDVYSFGVVLLEVITGQPPIIKLPEPTTIIQWTRQRLARGNIEGVVDVNMPDDRYDINCIWKVADVALKCTAHAPGQRPTMTDVVTQLKECLELEETSFKGDTSSSYMSGSSIDPNSTRAMAARSWLFILCLAVAAAGVLQTSAQPDLKGFISIDCGLEGKTGYLDDKTNLSYVPDDGFTDAGTNHNISVEFMTPLISRRNYNLRSFPDGERNCYTLRSLTAGLKYLIRAAFVYGNYDGLKKPPVFDLYIGVNFLTMVNITGLDGAALEEAIVVVPDDFVQVCLVKYQVKKNWMGDPCVPKTLAWDSLTCSYSTSIRPRITSLNLSSSDLRGDISSSFANLKGVQYLNLSNNNLTGSIPDALSQLPLLAVLKPAQWINSIWTSQKNSRWLPRSKLENRRFTYRELEMMTDNFQLELGRGGFGCVYDGFLEDHTRVAVKLMFKNSKQGDKEFLGEILTRIHHKNLVSMIGYCKDGDNMALVYEYMSEGTLQEHIAEENSRRRFLPWRRRLQIALESAQGKYLMTMQPTTKSDVYSFGVVLLELVTGKPALLRDLDNTSIIQWVQQHLARGNIEDVVDARMHGDHDINSVWKVVDIALKCTMQESIHRPTMTGVVAMLQECIELENRHLKDYAANSENHNSSYNTYGVDQSTNVIQSNDAFEVGHNIARVPTMATGPVAR